MLRASLLGGVDGVVTSFAVAAGSEAGELGTRVAVIIGTSSVLADGVSMGISEFLSSSGERAYAGKGESPALLGAACFLSFLVCGIVPLGTYVAFNLLACAMFSLTTLMLLGIARALVSGELPLFGLAQTSALGAVAGAVAYGVGLLAHAL